MKRKRHNKGRHESISQRANRRVNQGVNSIVRAQRRNLGIDNDSYSSEF